MKYLARQFINYLPYAAPLLSFIVLVLLLNRTSPLDVGPAGILLIFGVTYVFIVSIFYLLLTVVLLLLASVVKIGVRSKRKLYYIASILAFAPIFLLALNSIGQLELKDFILVILFVGVACFYAVKRS